MDIPLSREDFEMYVNMAAGHLNSVDAEAVVDACQHVDRVAFGRYVRGHDCGCPLVTAGLIDSSGVATEKATGTREEYGRFIDSFDGAIEQLSFSYCESSGTVEII